MFISFHKLDLYHGLEPALSNLPSKNTASRDATRCLVGIIALLDDKADDVLSAVENIFDSMGIGIGV